MSAGFIPRHSLNLQAVVYGRSHMVVVAPLSFVAGACLVLVTMSSALRTMVVPRGVPSLVTRVVFVGIRRLFRLANRFSPSFDKVDRRMAFYGPVSLLVLPMVWLGVSLFGYALMYWALGTRPLQAAYALSGSSMFTLGFVHPHDLPRLTMSFSEAALGIGVLALLITYLPSIYSTFARRENGVALLEARAGSPPSGPNLIIRYYRIGWSGGFDRVWMDWQTWFADVEESHTSISALIYFRSPQPDQSWITAAGAVLDAASLVVSTLERERDAEAQLLVRSGYVSLRRVADVFDIPYDPDPSPDGPISVTRHEFDAACDRMAEAGVPIKADRDQAWRDFSGWRVNYDRVLISLAGFVEAPPAPWSSDRSVPWRAPRFFYRPRTRRHLSE